MGANFKDSVASTWSLSMLRSIAINASILSFAKRSWYNLGRIVSMARSRSMRPYVGGIEQGVRGRGAETKFIVVIAIEVLSLTVFGRVRMQRVDDVSGASLVPFVSAAAESGSEVHTDGWKGYNGLSEQGYRHRVTNISGSGDPAHVSMPGVHRVASLLKRWLLGTHQESVTAAHLDAYLNEFAFRFNRRHSRRRGLLFLRLLQHAVVTLPTRYRSSRAREQIGEHNI